jgi:VIT1/CCC1 family predicted Fe2+/Mn2+ transporter
MTIKNGHFTGLSFGLTSGIITTLGLMIGLHASNSSLAIIIGGILTIAVADSLSDALGIHLAEESKKDTSHKEVWQATISTFLMKLVTALFFILPLILLPINWAIIFSIIVGTLGIAFLSYKIAKRRKSKAWHLIREHVLVLWVVLLAGEGIGRMIAWLAS